MTNQSHEPFRHPTSSHRWRAAPRWLARAGLALALATGLSAPAWAADVDVQIASFTDSPDPAVRGGNITYSITFENSAANTANNVVLSFPLPSDTQFVSASDPAAPAACVHGGGAPGTVTCSYAQLAGSVPHTVAVVLKTMGSTVNTVAPTVTLTTSDNDTNPGNNTAGQNTTISNGADLHASLSGAPNPVQGGDNITWTIAGGNQGPNDASSGAVRVRTTLPAGVSYVSAGGGGFSCSSAGSPVVVTCDRAAGLVNGATFSGLNLITKVTGTVSGALTLGTDISSLSVADPDSSNNGPTATVTVNPGADLRITQNAPAPTPAISGQSVVFTLNPENLGSSAATNGLDVTYQLPADFTFVSGAVSSGSAAGWGACTANGSLVTCPNTASYASGRSNSLQITATAPTVLAQTPYTGITATIAPRPGSPTDPVPGNNSASVDLNVVPDGVDLSLNKTKLPQPAAIGNTVTSSLRVSNAGPKAAGANEIVVTDTLDLSKESYAHPGFSGTGWSCAYAAPTLTCTYGPALAAGASATPLVITTTATANGSSTNLAAVACAPSTCTDWNPGNNNASATISVTNAGNSPDLHLAKSAATAGGVASTLEFNETTLDYTLVLTNKAGSPDAQDIVVTDALPGFITGSTPAPVIASALTNTSGASTASFACATASNGTVTCTQNAGTVLKAGDVVTFTIPMLRPIRAGSYTNRAEAFSTTQGDPNRSDNEAAAPVIVDPIADVEMVSKLITSATDVAGKRTLAGTNATYVLTFKNNGPDAAQNVVVTDAFTVPAGEPGFTVVSHTSNGDFSCSGLSAGTSYGAGTHTLTCTKATAMPGAQTHTVTVVVRPNWKAGQIAGSTWNLANTASISTSTKEASNGSDNGNNSQSETLRVDAAAVDALVNNTDNVDPLGYDPVTLANNDVTYDVEITNGGPSLATGVRFTYTMTPPAGKTVTFRGDGAAAGVAAANPAGAIAGSICTPVNTPVTGPTPLTLSCTFSGSDAQLAANAKRHRYLVFRVDSVPEPTGSTLTTRATVSTNETDSNASNNSEDETTSVRVRADLEISKTPSANPVQLREPFHWTIAVQNEGPGDSQNTSLTDTLPVGMEFFGAAPSWSKSGGASGSCTTAGQVLSCTLGKLDNGASATVTVPVRMTALPAGGTTQNCATVTTSEVDPSVTNNTSVCNTPALAVQKSSLAGTVYADNNHSGGRDAGEGGIGGVTLTLTGTDAYGNPVNETVTSQPDGSYLFDHLSPAGPGGYTLRETQPPGWGDGGETLGNVPGSTQVGNDELRIPLPANTAGTGYDFGEIGVSLAGSVFADANGNGQRDAGEVGVPGVTITLSGQTSTGVDLCTLVNCTITTGPDGSWSYPALPPSGPGGYTVAETQPPAFDDGGDQVGSAGEVGPHVNDRFTVVLTTPGTHAKDYHFGEVPKSAATASLEGHVWLDKDHDRAYPGAADANNVPQAGWTVELLKGGTLLASQQTAANGSYKFEGLLPGNDYQVRFRHPTTGLIWGSAVPNEQGNGFVSGATGPNNPGGAATDDGSLKNITLTAGQNLLEQSLPLDPAGVVYDAVTRQPVPGAVVSISYSGAGAFDPATHLVGGSATVTTGADGRYQFLLVPGAPAGDYTLSVATYPAGYLPQPSTMIPVCSGVLPVGAAPDPALVQASDGAPASGVAAHDPGACQGIIGGGAATTQYYFSFNLNGGSANVLNNHIPLDPILGGAIRMAKTTPKVNVTKGELVPYTVTATNTLSAALANVDVQDQIPPGFRYRLNSASYNGLPLEPAVSGRLLTWPGQTFAAGETKTFKLLLLVGAGVGEGEYVNQAWALSSVAGARISNVANAVVRVVPDPLFDCSDLIGTVFDDKNANGWQDQGERGIPNVRVVTARGLLVTTDAEGRFHVACAAIPQMDRGSNFVMKLDERTLPSGFRLTTENPRDVRVTRGKMVKLNFGATVHKVLRLELDQRAFAPDAAALTAKWQEQLTPLVRQLAERPTVLRIAYRMAAGEAQARADERLAALAQRIRADYAQQAQQAKQAQKKEDAPRLVIETESFAQQQSQGSAQ